MKKKIVLAATLTLLGATNALSSVSYEGPDPKYEANLNEYGTGVKDWEESKYMRLTMSDTQLFHYYAKITPPTSMRMPLKVTNTFDISKIMVDDVIPGKKISMYNLMRDRASVDSYVIMNKKGEIVAEDYWSNTSKETNHHLMSAHKSFSSMAAYIVADKGFFKTTDKAGKWIKELKGTPWADISLQDYADMNSGMNTMLGSKKGYHNWGMPDGSTWDSSMSAATGYSGLFMRDGKLLPPLDNQGDLRSFSDYLRKFATTRKPDWKAGYAYQYRGLNTEILALAAERSAKVNLAEMMDKYLWSKGGFQYPLSLFVNQVHDSLASGSMNCSARDFAIGSWLMVNDGKNWKGEQVVPKAYIEQILKGDQKVKDAFPRKSYEVHLAPHAFYKNQWRTITDDKTGRTYSTMVGVNGQLSAFDHKTGNVIAVFGSYREHTGTVFGKLYVWEILFKLFDEMEKQGIK